MVLFREECAEEMAFRVKEKFGTDIGVGITGASWTGSTWWTAGRYSLDRYCIWSIRTISYKLSLSGMRNTNRLRAVKFTIHYLIRLLREQGYVKI